MQLKRFRGPTVRDALASARAELGPEAVVLSSRMVPAHGLGGWLGQRVVEVTAGPGQPVSESRTDEPAGRSPSPPVRQRTSPAMTSDLAAAVAARLAATGLDRVVADEVARRIPPRDRRNASFRDVRHALGERLQWLAAGEERFAPVEVFVGPPGAGKTTSIAKVAAQQRARRGLRLGMVAADGFRVGAVEQLRIYADIIGSPFSVARTLRDLERVVAESRTTVLVDTAGRCPEDRELAELLGVIGSWPGVRTHLVVPATYSSDLLARVVDAYAAAQPSRVLFTRLDESPTLAPFIGLLRNRDLVVSYLSAGQRVPEDLAAATPSLLAAYVLGEPASPGDRR